MSISVGGGVNYAASHAALARVIGDRPAVRWRGQTWTWAELDDRVRRLAGVLRAAGVGREVRRPVEPWDSGQDHVAVCLTNGNEHLEAVVGSFAARAVPCNVNHKYRVAEMRSLFAGMRPAAIVFHSSLAATVTAALDGHRPLLLQVMDDPTVELVEGAVEYEAALQSTAPFTCTDLSPDDRYAMFTGGTTGAPKGVLWRQGDFIAACLAVTQRDGKAFRSIEELVGAAVGRAPNRALAAAPFMHGAAQWSALATWLTGGTVVVQRDPSRLDAADLLDTIADERCTSLAIVGDAFAAPLLAEAARQPRDLSSLRVVRSGGAVLSPANKHALRELIPGVRVLDLMGSTEAGTLAIGEGAGASTFAPAPSTCVLADDRSRRLEPGDTSVGWLAAAGTLPVGYLDDPEATATTFPEIDGVRYVVVGDRAAYDADGHLRVLGRESTCVNTGGEKVFVEEVEQALKAHPSVFDCLVVGRPHPRWGNELVAVLALRDATVAGSALEDELSRTAAEHLAGFKVPKAWVFVENVARMANGKPDYQWARRQATAT